tara:strand:+ start:703 stop:951 length:249 start_codon:yes stop_codon:yes gene_type:complete
MDWLDTIIAWALPATATFIITGAILWGIARTLPGLFVMTQPVRVVRSSGTLISASISLGYEVDRHGVRETLGDMLAALTVSP